MYTTVPTNTAPVLLTWKVPNGNSLWVQSVSYVAKVHQVALVNDTGTELESSRNMRNVIISRLTSLQPNDGRG